MAFANNFSKVREAFSASPHASISALGVKLKSEQPHGDWLQCACPICPDKSGSASVSHASGYLRCHQCGASADLFTWYGQVAQLTKPWEICQAIAKLLNVNVETKRKKIVYRNIPLITEESAEELKMRLFADEKSEPVREFLRSRKLWDPEFIEKLPMGAYEHVLIFFQHDAHTGRLLPRCKVYDPYPPQGRSKWSYGGGKAQNGRTVSFWPYVGPWQTEDGTELNEFALKDGMTLLLCEGEWDVLSALKRLGIYKRGMAATCWTGGGGSPIPMDAVGKYMRNKEVHIVYDNDVFQGTERDDVAPDEKKATEMRMRKKNLIENVGGTFLANRCSVHLRKITINPLEKWGGDLRDMIDAGLTDIDDLPTYPLWEAKRELVRAKRVDFVDVHKHLNQYIEFRCQVGGIHDDVTIVPKRHTIECAMGTKKICDYCRVPELAANGVLDWQQRQASLALAMTSNNMPKFVMERVVEKPQSCNGWNLIPIESSPGSRWLAMAREEDEKEDTRVVEVISSQLPPLSGELLVRGWLYISSNGTTPVLFCDYLEAADKVNLPLEPFRFDIETRIPNGKDVTVEQIDAYLDEWHKDVSNNTTHVYGRKDLHIGMALTMHSALWFDAMGARRRGWLDICIMGATRTGKSAAARSYIKTLFGQHHTPMGNFSRAGLTLGTASINGQQKMLPGLFPRNHGKLMVMDEAHLMVQDHVNGGGLFPMLQGARDIGKVEASKVSGTKMLPAAVRLIAIANWLQGGKHAFVSPCHHLLALYGTPESLARMDFAIPVDEIEKGYEPEVTTNFWTAEKQRAVAIRAWNLKPEDIVIEDEAIAYAQELCQRVWKDKYTEEIPLYTEKEKVYSVLRIAIALANMLMSSEDKNWTKTKVRYVHVEWARRWLEHTWQLLGYENVSNTFMAKISVRQTWIIESLLTAGISLGEPGAVRFVLGKLFGVLNKEELRATIGVPWQEFEGWMTRMLRAGGLELVRSASFGSTIGVRMTKPAVDIILKLIAIAENEPDAWRHRVRTLESWWSRNSGMPNAEAPANIAPIDAPLEIHLNDYRKRGYDTA
jgi:hypothetical protein